METDEQRLEVSEKSRGTAAQNSEHLLQRYTRAGDTFVELLSYRHGVALAFKRLLGTLRALPDSPYRLKADHGFT